MGQERIRNQFGGIVRIGPGRNFLAVQQRQYMAVATRLWLLPAGNLH